MTPIYIPNLLEGSVDELVRDTPWLDRTSARRECFMSAGGGISYTYGKGRGVRTYVSIDYTPFVSATLNVVNEALWLHGLGKMNGCFLNCYMDDHQHLGWHADDFREMDHTCPVVSVSFGEPREIWWRKKGEQGVVPASSRQLLGHGSMFVMPPGMQDTHEHRVPKGDRAMGPRVSLTFRRFFER